MKTKKMTTHFLSALAVAFFIFIAFGSGDDDSKTNADGTPKTERQIQLEKQFSAWDGSHIELTKIIKKAMNDPDSYEHVETVYWDMTDHVVVRTTYSGKNAFGGRVKNWVKAKADNNGKIIEIIEEGN
ncbi:MAG: hypothetical protein O9297_10915 [Flavobacterium sp.]|jgi:hypothetical protein|uniref:hypothetical protein n=1 Tax=Flavobacterium sp. TaxID=239 RepID=UPI0022BD1EDB|nr:hypothetical protein [Flavobacterium sp.]MCZ8297715.1 hypothetical protein [Flavobacterium sp.]